MNVYRSILLEAPHVKGAEIIHGEIIKNIETADLE